ncbi:hypothetical protein HDV64DRAFT_266836 [Trichoderma sp. TUCIM 5745]
MAGTRQIAANALQNHLLKGKSQEHTIRAVTRAPNSAVAKALAARGIEVVQADLDNSAALRAAFTGSLAADKEAALETDRGIKMANAALATDTLPHHIWPTFTDSYIVTGGKSVPPHYEYKARVQVAPSDQSIACIGDTRSNFGAFVEAALAQPEKLGGGQTVFAFVERSTLGGLLKTWAEAHDVKATYVQIPRDTFFSAWSAIGKEFTLGMEFWQLVRDKEWTDEDSFLTYTDLGIDITALKSVKDSFAELELQV